MDGNENLGGVVESSLGKKTLMYALVALGLSALMTGSLGLTANWLGGRAAHPSPTTVETTPSGRAPEKISTPRLTPGPGDRS